MCWQCENPEKTQSDYLDLLRAEIRTRGWVVQYVEDDRRPFAYTVGLHDRGSPEFLVTGLAQRPARWLLDTFAKRAFAGGRLPVPGDRISLPARTRVELVTVDHPDAHLYMAIGIEGPEVKAMQLVWADDRGRWPWAPGFDGGRRPQPVFGVRAAA